MSVHWHIMKASGRLAPFYKMINSSIRWEVAGASNHIPSRYRSVNIDIVVVDQPEGAIPKKPSGGFAPNAHLMYVYIDPAYLSGNLIVGDLDIRSTVAHEFHHCIRWGTVGYGSTLLEAIVSEGLADHFDLEVNGGELKPWSRAFDLQTLGKVRELAEKQFHNSDYNHRTWFFNDDPILPVPMWAGYSLGFDIVEKYKQKTGKTAAELVAEPAEHFAE